MGGSHIQKNLSGNFLRKWSNFSAAKFAGSALRQKDSATQIKVEENRSTRESLEIRVGEKLTLTK